MEQYYTQEYVESLMKACNKLQKKYTFNIPIDLLEELIDPNCDKFNLRLLINAATLNHRISRSNAKILKDEYCYVYNETNIVKKNI